MAARDPVVTPGFGDLLRAHRTAAGLSQEALAERAGLSARAVGDLERGAKLRPHPETLRRLADALGLGQSERAELAAAARPESRSAALPQHGRPSLPIPPTPLVGRERETAAVRGLLLRDDVRLVTLTGPGGVGKTRLALHAAAVLQAEFPDGARFVDLAPLADPALVAVAVADALGVRDASERPLVEVLADQLRDKRLMLVLDNFEHLMEAAPLVGQLLGTAAGPKVLATSRARLRLRGEHERPIPPLDLPDPAGARTAEHLLRSDAVRLFVQRAVEVRPDFAFTDATAPAVAEICARLDGLPLAIELAAARAKLLPPAALLGRLERRLPLLVGGARDLPARQRTLRDAIAWSHDLLSPPGRALFRRLAVFAGGCTVEAAEAVADPDGRLDAFAGLAELVDGSLLREEDGPGAEAHPEPRFGMLETVREYALERLAEAGEWAATRRRHAAWCLAFAEGVDGGFWGAAPGRCLDRLEAEQANFWAALTWALERGETELGLRLTSSLWTFNVFRGQMVEARRWQARLLASEGDVAPVVRALAVTAAGELARLSGDPGAALRYGDEGVALARQAGDPKILATALYMRSLAAEVIGDHDRHEALSTEALALFRELGEAHWTIEVLISLGRAARKAADARRVRALLEEARALGRETGDAWAVAWTTTELAEAALADGELGRAAALFGEGVRLHAAHGDQMGIDLCLLRTARIAGAQGRADAAARLLGAAEALREGRGAALAPDDRRWHDDFLAELRGRLGGEAFTLAYATGRALTLDKIVADAAVAADELARGIGAEPGS
jgi:predicted ATPase/DNA-binding XRE family transcriptional regulator